MKKIAVIGSLNMDFVANVGHMPEAGETILAESFTTVPGGKGANQAFALGRMGADVIMLGAVGKDANGDMELENLRHAGVDVSHVARTDASTGMALIAVNSQGDNSIIVIQGANLEVNRAYIDANVDVLRNSDIVVMQLEIPLDTVLYATRIAKSMGKIVILDPAPAPDSLPDELLTQVDILKPNETELATLSGIPDAKTRIRESCENLTRRGVGIVLASLGRDGVYVAQQNGEPRHYACEEVKVVDTTAAGDSFTAATVFALAKGCDIFEAVKFANRVAAIVVTRKGAQDSIPTREEIQQLWKID